MSNCTEESEGFEIGLLEAQGGKISYDDFYELITQLEKTHSLDYVNPLPLAVLPDNLGEFDVIYVILLRGYKSDLNKNGDQAYIHATGENGSSCWLAGFASLLFPASSHRQDGDIFPKLNVGPGNAAEISISLLPAAQRRGYGHCIVRRLVMHAFNILRMPRVTASVICPVRPSYSANTKKQILYNAKQLCWLFERAAKDEGPVWHDVHRLSMLQTDYFDKGRSYFLSHTLSFNKGMPMQAPPESPWETLIQRQEEEKRDVESWQKKAQNVSVNDACDNDARDEDDEDSDEETVLGVDSGGSDQDWDMASDFDD
ncbi:hypothetical protein OPQ81_008798 [Rhizoctonia solani]|nr:hypothetical protein OPQ81_008798 [Rhizoctonia solani]